MALGGRLVARLASPGGSAVDGPEGVEMVVPHCFPSHDEEFRAAVEHALAMDGATPESAAETLRALYPKVAVRPREHLISIEITPDHEVWYFFRDGSAYPRPEELDGA